jgi:hypothetical protein
MPVECLIPDDRLKLLLFCYGFYWKVEHKYRKSIFLLVDQSEQTNF